MTLTAQDPQSTRFDLGPASALSCRACGHQSPLAAEFACPQCFGPLEIAYDFGDITRADIERGPKSIWRYKGLLPVPSDVDAHPNTDPGFTRLVKADRLGAALDHGAPLALRRQRRGGRAVGAEFGDGALGTREQPLVLAALLSVLPGEVAGAQRAFRDGLQVQHAGVLQGRDHGVTVALAHGDHDLLHGTNHGSTALRICSAACCTRPAARAWVSCAWA